MTKTLITGAVIILVGWAGFAVLSQKSAEGEAMMQDDSAMIQDGNAMAVPASDTMMQDEMVVATGTDAMMQDKAAH